MKRMSGTGIISCGKDNGGGKDNGKGEFVNL